MELQKLTLSKVHPLHAREKNGRKEILDIGGLDWRPFYVSANCWKYLESKQNDTARLIKLF